MFSLNGLILVVCAYFLGAIPFGYIVGKTKGIDIRELGSGNVGFTNVWRTLGFSTGLIVLVGDVTKGFCAAMLGFNLLGVYGTLVGGLIAMLGHTFSIFINLKGGKGVATGVGILLFISPQTTLICASVAVFLLLTTKYMSLGSIVGAWLAPVLLYFFNEPVEYVLGIGAAAFFIICRHIPNIQRLMHGKENKMEISLRKHGGK